MHCAELSILLHRALEARVQILMNCLSNPGWQGDMEALHQVRVASRRVRAVLDMVDPDLYPGFKRQGRKVRRLTRALGLTREMDVHVGILEELGRRMPGLQGPAMEHALEAIEAHRRKARKGMERALGRCNLKHLPQLLQVPSLPDPFCTGDLAGTVWSCLEPWLAGALPSALLLDQEDARALHLLRIRVKRLRYALEVLDPGFPVSQETALKHLRALQTALGDHHDRAVLEAQLRDLHRGLELRGRQQLAAGIVELLTLIGEERLIAFEQFRALGVRTSGEAFIVGLRRDLGLEPEGNPTP
jgi:CHAD domain-containing protein